MKRFIVFSLLIVFVLILVGLYLVNRSQPPVETKFVQPEKESSIKASEDQPKTKINAPVNYHLLTSPTQTYQTFNNCGPATLSMMFSWYGVNVSQKELGDQMRPYQHPKGDNDDKTIFTQEFATWAEKYGFSAVSRVNGTIDLLKLFLANDIPVVTKTWLRPNEDIGHFRIVLGFDESKKVIIQNDSYHGPNKRISYFDFLSMWQSFNYAYIIIYPKEKEALVFAILADEKDESIAWQKAVERAKKEAGLDPKNVYPLFNQSTSYYHLNDYKKSVETFEKVEAKLPRRMLWYQIEPILAYQRLGNFDRVFEITNNVLENGNRAYSELYQIRGEIYLAQGNSEKAKKQFKSALTFNKNFNKAKESLKKLNLK